MTAPPDEPSNDASPTRTRLGIPSSELGLLATSLSEPRVQSADEATADDVWIGRTVGGVYAIEARIGAGGMGAVYRARHLHLGKEVAVKVLVDTIATRKDAVERLRQEAIAASSIDHDNIVDVISFDRYEDGSVFIIMELLRGESLADRLEVVRGEGRAMSVAEALPIGLQIADALEAAHQRGIVHRDLKPENIFLAKKGGIERVKVLDFGISKIKLAEAEQVRVTRTGQIVGTPLYMSPEQARGEADIDRRVDVYALGVILFEMLSGAPPFDGRNYFELLWKHGNERAPRLADRVADASRPAAIDDAIERALAKQPDDRFATMEEFARALAEAVPELRTSATSLPPGVRASREPDATTPPTPLSAPERPSGPLDPSSPSAPRAEAATAPRPMLWIGAVGLLVVLGALGLYASIELGREPATTSASVEQADPRPSADPPERPIAGSREEPATASETPSSTGSIAPHPPSLVAVSLGSDPLGAEVSLLEGGPLCTTPCIADLPAEQLVTLVFRRAGYHDAIERLTPRDDATVSPRLRARRVREGQGSSPTIGPPIKTTL